MSDDFSNSNEDSPQLSRRSLLRASLPVLAAAGFGLPSAGCGGANIPTRTVVAGSAGSFQPGSPQRLEEFDVFVIRTDEGIAAVSGRCTHRGCGVTPADGGGFRCGCHGSVFAADGTVQEGPAERDLEWFAVRIENGQVTVDPTRTVAKGTYTPL